MARCAERAPAHMVAAMATDAEAGIICPNCSTRSPGLKPRERRKATKRHGVGFWSMTIITLGMWALWRAIFGRKQILRYYQCPSCGYQWSP